MGTVNPSYPTTLSSVRAALGGTTATKLSAYVRGGAYVGNYAPNLSVPTSVPIRLGDLRGASSTPTAAATASPSSVDGLIASPGTCNTNNTTVTVTGGGTNTFAWTRVSGDVSTAIKGSASANPAYFQRSCTVANAHYTSVWKCTVTNSINGTLVTNNVNVDVAYEP